MKFQHFLGGASRSPPVSFAKYVKLTLSGPDRHLLGMKFHISKIVSGDFPQISGWGATEIRGEFQKYGPTDVETGFELLVLSLSPVNGFEIKLSGSRC